MIIYFLLSFEIIWQFDTYINRGTETPESKKKRLEKAREELAFYYSHPVCYLFFLLLN